MKMTIGKRVATAVGSLSLLLAVVGGLSYTRFAAVHDDAEKLNTDVMPGLIQSSAFYNNLAKGLIRTQLYAAETEPDQRRELMAEITQLAANADAAFKAYEGVIVDAHEQGLFDRAVEARDAYRPARAEFFRQVEARDPEAPEYFHETVFPLYRAYAAAAENLLTYNVELGERLAAESEDNASSTAQMVAILVGVAIVVGVGISFLVIRGVNKVLGETSQQLSQGADQTSAAAAQVSSSSQSLAEGASEQAASLEETSAALSEISSMTKRNSESALQAKHLANRTRQAAESGSGSMEEMNQAMNGIKDASASVAKIVKTIDEIAFQTNILALNAAVEAARAGEAGMGFAVVAEEVRALAQRSAQSAKETAAMIEESVSRSEHGVRISGKVAESFTAIVANARQVDDLVAQIASASEEQSQGIAQVTSAVGQMDTVTQTNASSAEEAAAAAEELNAQAAVMRESMHELQALVGQKAGTPHAPATPPRRTAVKAPIVRTFKRASTPATSASPAARPKAPAQAASVGPAGGHDQFFA